MPATGTRRFDRRHHALPIPSYRGVLHDYLGASRMGHFRHDLSECFALHRRLLETGTMLPEGS